MGYIPPQDAEMQNLAEIVQQISVEGDPRRVVHTALVLIRGDSPDEAYAESQSTGECKTEISYEKP